MPGPECGILPVSSRAHGPVGSRLFGRRTAQHFGDFSRFGRSIGKNADNRSSRLASAPNLAFRQAVPYESIVFDGYMDVGRQFLADTHPQRRKRLVDELLERPEYATYWALKWSDLLMINGTLLRPDAVKSYYMWIHEHVRQNTPWNQFVRRTIVPAVR